MKAESTTDLYRVVVDQEGHASIWPGRKPVPTGWEPRFTGARAECLVEIEDRWARGTTPGCRPAVSLGDATLLDLFRRSVARGGDRPAVSDDRRGLTYAELNAASSALTRWLREDGVRPGDHVVIYLERGVDVLIAMLAILKAGAAYVPVDVRYPDARRDVMVRTSRCTAIVSSPDRAAAMAAVGPKVLAWTGDAGIDAPLAAESSDPARPGDAACVLFTSGSSGRPKAVVLEHRNLVAFARNAAQPGLAPDDRTAQVSSVSWDPFHFETWCTLAAGAEVVVLPAIADLVAADLREQLRRHRITVMVAPTMVVNHVVREDRDAFSPLRLLITGGDVILPAACRELLSGTFTGRFINMYGPTETTTACTAYPVTEVAPDADSVPIGSPLADTAVYLLDGGLDEVAEGEAGEIHVGGLGVARGYLDQPALTAQRFLPDPFAPAGGRMYATGDRARWHEDGSLEFLGRTDDQVKIRGYRVEPREVERIVSRHPRVREVAVAVVGDDHDRRLVALVVVHNRVTPKSLREYVAGALPDFMVPAAFVEVPEIPANDNGKRDLQRLADFARHHLRRGENRVAPADDVEHYLATLWEELLAVEWIGATDDFFALGGNSLLAFRAQRRIRGDLLVDLDVREIIGTSELRALARLIHRRKDAVRGAALGPPVALSRDCVPEGGNT
ncbi:amino acid adenylation domain-containing protein [Phytohabitans suffuscus]|uniref:amino acid adenylation domain-containing protein n=1 Tax=Phytohabitans suffuscus TaxID=624315 RepID=UPI0015632D07|nr:amino acid adenylation domain-containing protein [Phytohabitans suffuscus]